MKKEMREVSLGAAQITLELRNNKITMYHSDKGGVVLRSWDAKLGDWGKMFDRVCGTFSDNKIIVDGPLWSHSRQGIRTLNELKLIQESEVA